MSNAATDKLRSLEKAASDQVMIVPVEKDNDGHTIAEVMAYGKGEPEISFQEEMLKTHTLVI